MPLEYGRYAFCSTWTFVVNMEIRSFFNWMFAIRNVVYVLIICVVSIISKPYRYAF